MVFLYLMIEYDYAIVFF